ncbi:hypothetical protein, partial [uncultured Brevundimonas sp.]|uniref:hypothetical protein n=1 Tax=uncultured Brevundimonas sp. TaxID=213418 RepID=UPI0026257817
TAIVYFRLLWITRRRSSARSRCLQHPFAGAYPNAPERAGVDCWEGHRLTLGMWKPIGLAGRDGVAFMAA